MNDFDLIVVGGGAAGFFGAIQAAEMQPGLKILIVEKTNKLLSKVRVSGGGRCNVTHNCFNPTKLSHHYPRGEKQLQTLFKQYHAENVVAWFSDKGVELKTEDDGRMFPETDNSQTIIDCFLRTALQYKIKIEAGEAVAKLLKQENRFVLTCASGKTLSAKKILVAIGGNPKADAYRFIADVGHSIIDPIPSLFTFNDSEKHFNDLMGISVPNAEVKICGTKFQQQGPLLITHWGFSGPGVIKLSAWAAVHLHQQSYQFDILVSWIGPSREDDIRNQLLQHKQNRGKQKVVVNPMYGLPQRLWEKLCERSEINDQKIWAELPQKNMNRLMEQLIRCPFRISGKTTFKDEFVTCGGVDLKEVDVGTLQSKIHPGLYFAGEVLNIDGETGGFNFQSAWTTAYLAAKSITSRN
jgi:predicted Rossmann fold flavoprotein